ncbi:methyltransferase [Streptomyces sp. YGL11-2]|uniref:methyltransferase n=1 Tax=Streptomyces sp. YGL11-2 TaxID=3414028 RepID=UPI003CE85188
MSGDGVRRRLIGQITAYRTSKCLYAAVELGIPDLLARRPMTAAELAAETRTEVDPLRRVLDHLVVAEALGLDASGAYVGTEASRLLCREAPDGIANWVRCELQEGYWHSWDRLVEQLRTGTPAFELTHQERFFEWLARSPEISDLFDATMRDGSRDLDGGLAAAITLRPGQTVVDVGGGDGSLLAALLTASPGARGILFELPREKTEVVPALADLIAGGRARVERGSFFDGVPSGGEVHVLKRVLHDWDDERASRILGHCRDALAPGGRVVVVDMVLDDDRRVPVGRSLDVLMMILMAGRERTAADFSALGTAAGFLPAHVTATGTPLSVVELSLPAPERPEPHAGR